MRKKKKKKKTPKNQSYCPGGNYVTVITREMTDRQCFIKKTVQTTGFMERSNSKIPLRGVLGNSLSKIICDEVSKPIS